jgi:hypothetical protein
MMTLLFHSSPDNSMDWLFASGRRLSRLSEVLSFLFCYEVRLIIKYLIAPCGFGKTEALS